LGLVVLVVAMGVGLSGCDFDKKLNTSYTLHLWDDIPANWDADYYSWVFHQGFMLEASQLNARFTLKTPKGQGMPPTGFRWTLTHLDQGGSVVGTHEIPGTFKGRKYTAKAKLSLSLPAYQFDPGHELRVSGSFDGFVPRDTTIKVKMSLKF